jgi:hypothetical protein
MMNPTPADIEFAKKSAVLRKTMNPLMKLEDRTKIFVGFVNSLSDQTFMIYRDKILEKMNPSKDTCSKFKNTEEQVADRINIIPRLSLLKDELTARVRESRVSYGLDGQK